MNIPTIEEKIGNTPLVALQRLPGETTNTIIAKLEGNNPGGSVKDRAALSMIRGAEERGEIRAGDTLIEPTAGNTGIALAMISAIRGYHMVLVMPEDMPVERRRPMELAGAELILVAKEKGMMGVRDLAKEMESDGKGKVLDQFSNTDNPLAHYRTTGPEIWRDTSGTVSHFVSAMGTRGTIMGVSRYLKEMNPEIQVIGVQPEEGACIPGIRSWPAEYQPKFYEEHMVDRIIEVGQKEAEDMTRALMAKESIFAGISSGGAVSASLRLSQEITNAVIVTIICDRGDRYLSSGVFHS